MMLYYLPKNTLSMTILFMTVGGIVGILMMTMIIYGAMKSWEKIINEDDVVLVENHKN